MTEPEREMARFTCGGGFWSWKEGAKFNNVMMKRKGGPNVFFRAEIQLICFQT